MKSQLTFRKGLLNFFHFKVDFSCDKLDWRWSIKGYGINVPSTCLADFAYPSRVVSQLQGVSAKTWHYIKMLVKQSKYLESDHLYLYFSDRCLLTKTKLKTEHFKMNNLWVLNLFLKCFFTAKILNVRLLLTHPVFIIQCKSPLVYMGLARSH